jgi:hypothetical protein
VLRRRIVAVHEHGLLLRLPFRERFAPWREVRRIKLARVSTGRSTALVCTVWLADIDASINVGAVVDGMPIVEHMVKAAGLEWHRDPGGDYAEALPPAAS